MVKDVDSQVTETLHIINRILWLNGRITIRNNFLISFSSLLSILFNRFTFFRSKISWILKLPIAQTTTFFSKACRTCGWQRVIKLRSNLMTYACSSNKFTVLWTESDRKFHLLLLNENRVLIFCWFYVSRVSRLSNTPCFVVEPWTRIFEKTFHRWTRF